ncbi:hypothetical protein C2857_002815 [Epichloe festucae Fl1]|uniref:Cytochrome b-c1 complex subunit 10 n=1 Tax=Epichloe festucae (strain Fl1) TaxID=877507 RepID=A0A7U3SNH7_EPIFF|nr:hypothetical protein C2857_002815 [Epichloe festucae Fl1]
MISTFVRRQITAVSAGAPRLEPSDQPVDDTNEAIGRYTFQPHLDGWNKTTLFRNTLRTASYGGAAAVGLLYYVSGIPRVQEDILQKIPFVGRYFVKEEVDPQDNPF